MSEQVITVLGVTGTQKKYVPPASWGMLARIVCDRPLKWIAR